MATGTAAWTVVDGTVVDGTVVDSMVMPPELGGAAVDSMIRSSWMTGVTPFDQVV
jgi:hypothetical protein